MLVWRRLIDFFELRPFFTLWSLRVVWWLYIFFELEKLFRYNWFRIITGPSAPSWFLASGWSNAFFTLLRVLVLLAIVRLLLDVLLKFLMSSRGPEARAPRSWGQDAVAFLDLRPFYTPWWLQVFWWLFVLSVLRSVYIQVISHVPALINVPVLPMQSVPQSLDRWFRFIVGLLGPLTWLVGGRLLVEAALMSQATPPDRDAANRPN